MMSCREFRGLLEARRDGTSGTGDAGAAAEVFALDEHATSCASCERLRAAEAALPRFLAAVRTEDRSRVVPYGFATRVAAAARANAVRPPAPWSMPVAVGLAGAGALVAIAAFLAASRESGPTPIRIAQDQVVAAAREPEMDLLWSDGRTEIVAPHQGAGSTTVPRVILPGGSEQVVTDSTPVEEWSF